MAHRPSLAPSVTEYGEAAVPQWAARYDWVLAAPFRAHLRSLIEQSALPWEAVALSAGVPLPVVRSLLFGRSGRQQTRLAPDIARAIIALQPRALVALHRLPGDRLTAIEAVSSLIRTGLTTAAVAQLAGTDCEGIRRIICHGGWIDARTTLLLRAACAARPGSSSELADRLSVTDEQLAS